MIGDFPESNIFPVDQDFYQDLEEVPLLVRSRGDPLFHNAPFNPLYSGGETVVQRMEEGMGNGSAGAGTGGGVGAGIGGGAGEDGGYVRKAKWWRKFLAWCKKLRNKYLRRRSRK